MASFAFTMFAGISAATAETATPVAPATAAAPSTVDSFGNARIIVVEWKIKKGHEQEFLEFWKTKSVVADRSGLIAEFMTSPESKEKYPWISWASLDSSSPDYTTFYNIGIWKQADDFVAQIGKYIDINRPSMAFEAAKRHRILLAPDAWRIGMTQMPTKDAEGVK